MNHLPTSRTTPLRKSIRTLLPLAAAGLFASSPAHAEQWTKSDSNAWTNAPSWFDSAPGAPAPPGTAGSIYTDVRINLQGGTTIYSATEGIQTYDVSATGGETRAWVMSNIGGANSTFTMTGGELIFVQDAATTAVVLSNAALTATINLNGGKMTINETDTNADTVIQIGFGGGGTGIFNINSGGVFTVDRVDLGQVNSALNLNSGGLLVARTIFQGSGSSAAVNFDGGTIRLRGNTSANLIEESVTTATINGGGLTVDTAGFNAVVAKALVAGTGSGGLTKNNAGILTLAGNNTYAGTTTVNAGTLQLGNNGTTGSLLAGGTTLALNRSDALAQSTFTGAGSTFQSGLGGDVNFTKAGSGTFTADVANTYTGATTISAANFAGRRPLCSYEKMPVDYCIFEGRLVMGKNDTSKFSNTLVPRAQSNLWFGQLSDLQKWGAPQGHGSVWLNESVAASALSEPFLMNGFTRAALHLRHSGGAPPGVEVHASNGDGTWTVRDTITIPAGGATHALLNDFNAQWLRLRAIDAATHLTASFIVSNPYPHRTPASLGTDDFAALADIRDTGSLTDGIIRTMNSDTLPLELARLARRCERRDSAERLLPHRRPDDARRRGRRRRGIRAAHQRRAHAGFRQ